MLLIVGLQGCKGYENTSRGAAVGAGAGAVVGAVIGEASGKTATGAIIGAAVGGTTGALIGRRMDQQARELEEELEAAEIERVGEGIKVTFESGILFQVDESRLSSDAEDNLDELAESLKNYDGTNVIIVGHTDATGAEDYNQQLSEERARAAARYLVTRGVEDSRLSIVGYGETDPVASNDTVAGRQQNRRVEIAIFANEELKEELSDAG